jgi:hypothetical protein
MCIGSGPNGKVPELEESMVGNASCTSDMTKADAIALYLDIMKLALTDSIYWDDPLALYTFYSLKVARLSGNGMADQFRKKFLSGTNCALSGQINFRG